MKSSTITIIIIAILIVAGIVYYAITRPKIELYNDDSQSSEDGSINATADVDSINVKDIENELQSLETDLNQL